MLNSTSEHEYAKECWCLSNGVGGCECRGNITQSSLPTFCDRLGFLPSAAQPTFVFSSKLRGIALEF
jgi:hypothetical protein